MGIISINIPKMQQLVDALTTASEAAHKGDKESLLLSLDKAIEALEAGAMMGGDSGDMYKQLIMQREGIALSSMNADELMEQVKFSPETPS